MAHDEDLDNKIAWIEAELSNNEHASDEEMRLYFQQNRLDNKTIDLILLQRDKALLEISFTLDTKGMKL
jgi:hypothetical protein